MAAQKLRLVAFASFLPAFPLLLAHGIISSSPVPATGLVPLAFSAGASLFIFLRRHKSGADAHHEEEPRHHESQASSGDPSQEPSQGAARLFVVFVTDLILAAALLVVLVFSWLKSARFNGQQATLAAYGTIPLLVNL